MRRSPVRRAWLTVGLSVAALTMAAGCSSDSAPAGVSVGWADPAHQAIRVTWTESGSYPNKIAIEGIARQSPSTQVYTRPEEPDSVLLPTSGFPLGGDYRIAVSVGAATGAATSPAGRSPAFDTDGPVPPRLTSVRARGGGAVLVRWGQGPWPEDFTPGDPLDLPATTTRFAPTVRVAGQERYQELRPLGRSAQYRLASLRPPYRFQVRAVNEWGATWGANLAGDTTTVTARIQTQSVFGAPLVVRGRVVRQRLVCTDGHCASRWQPAPGVPVVLQTRDSPVLPWEAAGITRARAGGAFRLAPPAPGNRQYRVVASTQVGPTAVAYGSMTGVTSSRTRARALSAGFDVPVARYGQRVTATLRMVPATSIRATLQRWNGRTWIGFAYTQVRGGVATYAFSTRLRGSFGYRFVVPTTVYDGRAVAGISTASFVLTTR